MTHNNLYTLFESRFPADLGTAFLEHDRGVTTFADIQNVSASMTALLQSCGVKKGDRVLVQVEKSPEVVCLYLACLRAGAVFVPINTAYTGAEVDYFLGDAMPQLFVCDPQRLAELQGLGNAESVGYILSMDGQGQGSLLEQLDSDLMSHEVVDCAPDDLAAILYTSGTTGRSKGAMLSHRNLASNAQALHQYWAFEPGDVLLHALPVFHIHGLFVALHCALMNGSHVLFHSRFDVEQVIEDLPRASVMMGVPTFYVRLLGHAKFTAELVQSVRLFISGSAPLLADTFTEFEARTGQRILERYGMTETGIITSNPYSGERIAGTVGFALPDIQVRIADEQGQELPRGEIGVLEVKGPNVCQGYWQKPEKTAEEFREDGFFITGDMSVMDEEGRVSIVGRAKDLIISGGYNIYPKEIETEIDQLSGVIESAVIGVPHPDFGEAVTAVIVVDPKEKNTFSDDNLPTFLAEKLARFKLPKKVFVVEQLPRNAMGKVEKNKLRELYKDTFA